MIEYIIPIFWLGTNVIYLLFALIFDLSNSQTNESLKKQSKLNQKYNIASPVILMHNFIIKEIKVKRIVTSAAIIIVIAMMFLLNNYYQYRKTIIIKRESLVSYNGELSISEGNIVNKDGLIVRLKGVSTHNLYWFGRIYTKENLKELRDTWGINTIRLAIYTNPDEDGYIKHPEQISQIENLIDLCVELDLYVIVDWHILKDNDPNIYKKESLEFFETISNKYGSIPNVIYEICNEPNGNDVSWDEDIKPYAIDVIETIRNNSPNSLIIVGLADWCKDINSAQNNMLKDNKVLYSVHFYANAKDNNQLMENLLQAKQGKMPIIVSECGASKVSGDGTLNEDEFRDCIMSLEKNNISWIVWQFSEKDESSSLLIRKEIQDRLDFLDGKYTEKELKKKKYHINDYLSDTGKFMKKIFQEYN